MNAVRGVRRTRGRSGTWAGFSQTPSIDPATGDFYLYGNDIARGLDVYRYDGQAATSANDGRWLTPAQVPLRPKVRLSPRTAFNCLLPS